MRKKGENRNNMVETWIWKLKGIRRGLEKGRCPLYWGEEDVKHILLKCKESKKWREEWINSN
jgi:hypothetical protein